MKRPRLGEPRPLKAGTAPPQLFDGDGDDVGLHRRIKRDVALVGEHVLQRVLAGRKLDRPFGLRLAVVDVLGIGRESAV